MAFACIWSAFIVSGRMFNCFLILLISSIHYVTKLNGQTTQKKEKSQFSGNHLKWSIPCHYHFDAFMQRGVSVKTIDISLNFWRGSCHIICHNKYCMQRIVRLSADGNSQREVARMLGVSQGCISKILRRNRKTGRQHHGKRGGSMKISTPWEDR